MNLSATLAQLGPWLVTLAPAWFVYDSLTQTLDVPSFLAIPIAAGVELTGVAAFDTWLELLAWNRKRTKTDPVAPAKLALIPIAIYLATGIILTAVLKQNPTLALFFVLAAAGYGIIAIRSDQGRRDQTKEKTKANRKQRRAERRAERPAERPPDKPRPAEHSPELAELLQIIADNPERPRQSSFGQADVQRWIGKKRTTAYAVLAYGQRTGVVRQVGRGQYIYANGKEPDDAKD